MRPRGSKRFDGPDDHEAAPPPPPVPRPDDRPRPPPPPPRAAGGRGGSGPPAPAVGGAPQAARAMAVAQGGWGSATLGTCQWTAPGSEAQGLEDPGARGPAGSQGRAPPAVGPARGEWGWVPAVADWRAAAVEVARGALGLAPALASGWGEREQATRGGAPPMRWAAAAWGSAREVAGAGVARAGSGWTHVAVVGGAPSRKVLAGSGWGVHVERPRAIVAAAPAGPGESPIASAAANG